MLKKKIVDEIMLHLQEELDLIERSAKIAHAEATHSESKAEDQYDTRAIEAGYLAQAQAARADEIKRQILIFKYLPIREVSQSDVIEPGIVAELEHNGRNAYYFLVPQGGGLVLKIDDKPVQVITPQSPLGDALLGRKVDDIIEVEAGKQIREYLVVALH